MGLFGKKEDKKGCCCGGNCCSQPEQAARVKILGSGCAKCNQLEANTVAALKLLGQDETVEHVKDFAKIAAYGVMTTPALVVDGRVISYGKVPATQEIVELLKAIPE